MMKIAVLAIGIAVSVRAAPEGQGQGQGQAQPAATRNPRWLAALIRQLRNEPVWNPPAVIARYEYRGEVVYYLPSHCCDIPSTVYRAGGAILCHADGGMTGTGDGRCGDFYRARTNEKIIWRDARRR